MFYNILGIVVGVFLIASTLILIKSNKSIGVMNIVSFICGLGLLAVGIIGFLISSEYEFVTHIILLVFVCVYFIAHLLTKQKSK